MKEIKVPVIKDQRPYVAWRRVSTKEQGKSELGLEAQLTIIKMFTGREPEAVFTDICSGTKLDACQNLWKAIRLCKDNGYLLVVAKTDRFRNLANALRIYQELNPDYNDRNIIFCDLPETNQFVLNIVWTVWEYQAIQGRINTKVALNERKKQIKENGGFFSKTGNYRTHLGNAKGYDMSPAYTASGMESAKRAMDWRSDSALYGWVEKQILRNRPRKDILEEAQELYETNPNKFCTREGKPLCKGTLSRWVKEMSI